MKITNLDYIKCSKVPVYDLTISDKTPCFTLESGIVSHNTKRWKSFIHTIPWNSELREIHVSRFLKGILCHFDYSQMEVKILAKVSEDESLIKYLSKKGADIHRFVASKVWKKPMEEVTSAERRFAKTSVFAILYGKSIYAFATEIMNGDIQATEQLFEYIFTAFPGIKRYIDNKHKELLSSGEVRTMFGDTIIIPFDPSRASSVSSGKRQAQNYPIQCLYGGTKIPLLDGTTVEIKDLVGKKDFWVYSYDLETKKIVPGRGFNAHLSGSKVPVYKVTLEYGAEVIATDNHPWLLNSDEYVRTDKLEVGMSIRSLYRKDINGYELCSTKGHQYTATHQLVSNLSTGIHCHHKDFNKKNNTPDNLVPLYPEDHFKLHSDLGHGTNNFLKWSRSEKGKEQFKRNAKTLNSDKTIIEKRRQTMKSPTSNFNKRVVSWNKLSHPNLRSDITFEKILDCVNKGTTKSGEVCRVLSVSYVILIRELEKNGYSNWTEFLFKTTGSYNARNGSYSAKFLQADKTNHKVVAIEFYGYEDVYDITVDKYHNFAICADGDSGVFVHNSAASTVAGVSIYRVIKSLQKSGLKARGFGFTHDSGDIDLECSSLIKLLKVLPELAEKAPLEKWGVPVSIDIGIGVNGNAIADLEDIEVESDLSGFKCKFEAHENVVDSLIKRLTDANLKAEVSNVKSELDYWDNKELFITRRAYSMYIGEARNKLKGDLIVKAC